MRSRFALGGHPLHPLLATVPMGLAVWILVGDLVYLWGGQNRFWYDLAFWTGIATIGTALIAAFPGFGDYFTVALRSEARGIATIHMVLNLTVVGLFIGTALLSSNGGALTAPRLNWMVTLHAVAVGLLVVSGWLGGEMAYRHHLGMVPDDAEAERLETSRHHVPAGVR
jgi:uncharacterized membrane protein